MINPVNFCSYVNLPVKSNRYCKSFGNGDTFVSSQTPFDKSINQARAKIIEVLKERNNEYSIAIGPDGTILHENEGDANHCTFDSRKVVPDAALLHGHPIELPLSSGDVAVLLATTAKSQEAVTQDGKYSRLVKNHPYVDRRGYGNLYFGLEKQLCEAVLDKLGISYALTKEDLMDMFKDHLEYQTGMHKEDITDEKLQDYMRTYGLSIDDDNLQRTYNQLKEIMMFQLLTTPDKYDKPHNTIVANYDKIKEYLDSEDGLKLRHEFLIQLAKDYDLTYETNMEY